MRYDSARSPTSSADRGSGEQLHSAHYRSPQPFAARRVVVVGGGNSGAQIAADLTAHADVTWCTTQPPRFLPDEVDGRELFRVAWSDGTTKDVDAVIWCTGFRPQLSLLAGLALERVGGLLRTDGPVAAGRSTLGLVGYGDWCGLASATLIGVGQWARQAVQRAFPGAEAVHPRAKAGN